MYVSLLYFNQVRTTRWWWVAEFLDLVSIYIYMYVCMMYVCVCMFVYVCMCMYVCICVYKYVWVICLYHSIWCICNIQLFYAMWFVIVSPNILRPFCYDPHYYMSIKKKVSCFMFCFMFDVVLYFMLFDEWLHCDSRWE